MQQSALLIFFIHTPNPLIYSLSLHDALPISVFARRRHRCLCADPRAGARRIAEAARSEEHTSELQSRLHLVCRLLLEKKKISNVARHLPPMYARQLYTKFSRDDFL